MRLIGFAIYLGIGAMCHALFVGPQFDWTSAWTFGWLFGWPIMIFIAFWSFILAACVAILVALGVGWCAMSWLSLYANWKARRKAGRNA